MKQTSFMCQLGAYFDTYLPQVKKCSPNTITAYADSFALLFNFFREEKSKPHYLVNYKDFTPGLFDDFVLWLDHSRNYSPASKKQRMSAITSFFKYASRRDMVAINALSNAATTVTPRIPGVRFPYFSLEETKILLRMPDIGERLGSRDLVLLSLLYDTAARAQELCDICVGDIRFSSPAKVKLLGKGSKVREIPISDDVSRLLRYHLKNEDLFLSTDREKPLFTSQDGNKMTPACIRYLTTKYVIQAKAAHYDILTEPKYSPHSWRHSKAVHMVEAGIPLIYIRNFLGHSSIKSTERYARVSNAAVTKALVGRNIPQLVQNNIQPDNYKDTQLPDFLIKARK